MRFMLLAAALGGLLASAPVAAAGRNDFQDCDGYWSPGKKSDGIVTASWLFGLASASADMRRVQSAWGDEAVAACDRALASPLLEPRYWLRRAHLLQSKGMHLIHAKKYEEALKALDAADAAGAEHSDPLFAESVALGNRALRALALFQLGKRAEAGAELDAVDKARPYAASLRALTRSIRLLHAEDMDNYIRLLRDGAPLEPGLLQPLFRVSLMQTRFDEAEPIYGQISHDVPRTRRGWTISGLDERRYDQIPLRAELAGAMSYVLTAQGRKAEATALVASARSDLVDAMQPPVPESDGHVGKKALKDFEKRSTAGAQAGASLDAWEKAAALRAALPTISWPQFPERVKADLPAESPVILDLVKSARADDERERADKAATLDALSKLIEAARRKSVKLSFSELIKMLPRPETARTRPRYRSSRSAILFGDIDGATSHRHDDSDELTVGFGSALAPAATVDELALLSAAFKTREAGKDRFLIQSRMLIQRTMSNQYSSTPAGYEVRLRILPVGAGALPTGLEPSRWRLISAQEVIDRLYPKYAPAPAGAAD